MDLVILVVRSDKRCRELCRELSNVLKNKE